MRSEDTDKNKLRVHKPLVPSSVELEVKKELDAENGDNLHQKSKKSIEIVRSKLVKPTKLHSSEVWNYISIVKPTVKFLQKITMSFELYVSKTTNLSAVL